MYITAPIPITGNSFTLKSPRPSSGTAPVAIQITNNSSYVFGFTTGAEQSFIDPYTRSTYPLATVTDAIVMSPVYNAYALVGAGYIAADWLLPNEPASQADGALPISQLISQAIQQITSSDNSLTVANGTGPTTDLKVAPLTQLLGIPPPVNTGSTIQSYTDPLGDLWVAKNNVNNGNWQRAIDVLTCRHARSAALTLSGASDQLVILDGTSWDPYSLYDTTTGFFTLPVAGIWAIYFQLAGTVAASSTIRAAVWHGQFPSGAINAYARMDNAQAIGQNISSNVSIITNSGGGNDHYSLLGAITAGGPTLTVNATYYWTYSYCNYLGSG